MQVEQWVGYRLVLLDSRLRLCFAIAEPDPPDLEEHEPRGWVTGCMRDGDWAPSTRGEYVDTLQRIRIYFTESYSGMPEYYEFERPRKAVVGQEWTLHIAGDERRLRCRLDRVVALDELEADCLKEPPDGEALWVRLSVPEKLG